MKKSSLSNYLLSLDEQDNFSKMAINNMPISQFSEDFLLGYFQNNMIGHLVKGIVHNMNGSIQILSMQIELSKMDIGKDLETIDSSLALSSSDTLKKQLKELDAHLRKSKERLLQMEEVLNRIENMVNVIAYRDQKEEDGQKLFSLDRMIKEELAFWNADLFFKHHVKKKTDLSDSPSLTLLNEKQLRDLVDSLLGACIEQMREDETGNLKVTLSQKDEADMWYLEFEHTGKAFSTAGEGHITIDPPEVRDCIQKDPDNPLLILALKLAKVRAEQIGVLLKIEPQRVSCLIPNTHTKLASA